MRAARGLAILGLAVVLAGCSTGDRTPSLRDLSGGDRSPDEFAIVPREPLQQPPSLSDLPQPAPGAANRTDPNPGADAIAALGGNPGAAVARGTGAPASDAALIAGASRFGRDADIRSVLAAEDLAFRQRRSRFTWQIVPTDSYSRVYRRQMLDPNAWIDRYRAAGVPVPAAPPS